MRVLLVDVGNSRVKWAWLSGGRVGPQQAAANTGWRVEDYARRVIGRGWLAERTRSSRGRAQAAVRGQILVSSVAGSGVRRMLVAAARRMGAPAPQFFVSRRRTAGVVTSYVEPWRLGVDRLVGAIGARHLAAGRAVCVVNVGTAITIDLVDAAGRHRGGAIIPGPALMVESLLRSTSGIRRRARGGSRGVQSLFARTTRTAVSQGSRYASAAVIDRAILEAAKVLGRRPLAFLTGGGSARVRPVMRIPCVTVPDLVLVGLAVWAGWAPLRRRVN